MNRKEFTTEIYDLLWFCQQYNPGPKVLDCGCGGSFPKLYMFDEAKYELHGIDNDKDSLEMAQQFAEKFSSKMNLKLADIRQIPYPDNHFNVVYSYNTIFHMRKVEIQNAVNEIIRVMKSGAIGYINFIDIEDDIHRSANEDAPGEFIEHYDGVEVVHTLLTMEECEAMLTGVKILEKQRKFIDRLDTEHPYKYVLNDYFFQKL